MVLEHRDSAASDNIPDPTPPIYVAAPNVASSPTPPIDAAASNVASNLTPPTSHSDINTTASVQIPQSSAAVREVNVMFRNQMGPNSKIDERKFKNIMNTHVIPANNVNLKVLIYYKTVKFAT